VLTPGLLVPCGVRIAARPGIAARGAATTGKEQDRMRTIKDFVSVMDLQTLIVTLLAVGSTYACQRFGYLADIPTGLIGLAVVFPIVFSINAAYRRREESLRYFGELKAHAVALYYVHRDWVPGDAGGASAHAGRMREVVQDLLQAVREDLGQGGRTEASFAKVFGVFSRISGSLEQLRQAEVTNSEISRANQYMSKMMISYERMRNIALYRTPIALRAYSRVFLNLFPIAFGPYFAYLCSESTTFPYVGYMVAVLYSLVLVTLDNLQEHLEDPYDELGADDIKLDSGKDYGQVTAS
jgi:predicted membrane chloride channel (bestrophin family)